MTKFTKLYRLALVVIIPALAFFAIWVFIRLSNIDATMNLAFDGPPCAPAGATRAEVRECFRSRGYAIRSDATGSDLVEPRLILRDWSFKRFYFQVDYDKNETVRGSRLYALWLAM